MISLTTTDRVKTLFGSTPGVSSTTRDLQVSNLILQVSRQIQRYIGVDFELKDRTEVFDVAKGQEVFELASYPVVAITSVINDYDRVFTGTPIGSEHYTVSERGILTVDRYTLTPGSRVLEVKYNAGVAIDADDFIADEDYLDLALAAEAQILHIVTRAPHLGATSLSLSGGSRSFEQPVKLLPQVVELMEPFARG